MKDVTNFIYSFGETSILGIYEQEFAKSDLKAMSADSLQVRFCVQIY